MNKTIPAKQPAPENGQRPMPEQAQGQKPAPDQDQQPNGQDGGPEEMARLAMEYIYGSAEVFGSLIQMLKSNKQKPETGVAEAAVMTIEKMEQDQGEMSVDDLTAAGIAIVMSLLDLAQKAGVIPEVNEQIGAQTWGQAIKIFMKKHPGRIDPAMLQQLAKQGGAEQPVQAAPAPDQSQGLLGAV